MRAANATLGEVPGSPCQPAHHIDELLHNDDSVRVGDDYGILTFSLFPPNTANYSVECICEQRRLPACRLVPTSDG